MGRPATNLAGKIFGRLTVTERFTATQKRGARWKCVCECGKTAVVAASKLQHRHTPTKSCGCLREKIIDLSGERFGKLTVMKFSHFKMPHKYAMWECLCACGKTIVVIGTNLRKGNSTTCGCHVKDKAIKLHTKRSDLVILKRYRDAALAGQREWSLSDRAALRLFRSVCFYCGCPPSNERKNKYAATYYYNGIDRVDNNLGYTLKNSVPCCRQCNFAKGSLDQKEFILHVLRIATHQKK